VPAQEMVVATKMFQQLPLTPWPLVYLSHGFEIEINGNVGVKDWIDRLEIPNIHRMK
jgi:hypothetical protein